MAGKDGKRHVVYAKTLESLREKEKEIERDKSDGIKAEARYDERIEAGRVCWTGRVFSKITKQNISEKAV